MNLNLMQETTLLRVLSEVQKAAAYSEIIANGWEVADWASVAAFVRNGIGASKFPVGTQFETTHSVWGTILWDVVGHNIYKKPNDNNAPTMTLLAHYRDASGVQFDAVEAMYAAEDDILPAGAYSFIQGTTPYYFSLAHDVPVGGQICLNATPDTFTVYANNTSTSALETGSVGTEEIADAVSLGTLGSGNLNHWDRIRYGSNNYKESAMRQFLNSAASAGSVWTPQTKFDRPPSWAASKAGFMAGLPSDFLSVVGEVAVPCKTNTVYEAPDSTTPKNSTYTVQDKFYLATEKEVFGSESNPADGSSLLPYYDGADNTDRIKYYMNNTANPGYWWLRTPDPSNAHYVRIVHTSGALIYTNAYNANGAVPACTIY